MCRFLFALFASAALGLSPANGNIPEGNSRGAVLSDTVGFSADTLALIDGRRLLDEERYDLARERLKESALSDNIHIRIKALLYLNQLEVELENYDVARVYLEEYHIEAMRLFHHMMDMQNEMTEQMTMIDRRHRRLVGGVTGAAALILVGAVLLFMLQRRRRVVAKVSITNISDWHRYKADVKAFEQTGIFAEIVDLARQSRGRGARVMPLARQEALDRELAVVFAHFAVRLQSEYPSLTAGDVKLCCLSLAGLSTWARALCFGSTETNIIKQRKYKIKRKMELDANGRSDPRGTALFDFIFADRRTNAG